MNFRRPYSPSLWLVPLVLALGSGRLSAQAPATPAGTRLPVPLLTTAAADPVEVKGPQAPSAVQEKEQVPPAGRPTPPSTPTPASTQTQEPNLDPGQSAGDTGGETAALSAANMLGDLLYGTRSIRFFYSRGPAGISPLNVGSTNVLNSTIAENNSPIPQDRVYFRFNHFDQAQTVTGLADTPNSARFLPNVTKSYDANVYTFGAEKTFFCDRASVELRVPFATALSSKENLIPGVITGPSATGITDSNGNPPLGTQTIPGGTLGSDATEFGNISLIFKGLALKNETWAVSGGLGIDLPTAQATDYRIVDFVAATTTGSTVNGERLRTIDIGNDIVNLAPFVAALWTPTEHWFVQGFTQLDVPVGTDSITYHIEHTGIFGPGTTGPLPIAIANGTSQVPPFTQKASITDQTLLHLDLGAGYWFKRDPCDLITAIAPTLELHYTTTMCNSQVVQLKGDGASLINNPAISNIATRLMSPEVPEPGPQVGNLANRVDLLDLTVGVTVMVGDRVTIANGFAVPLRGGDNRTFDWEYQLQLNYYFGGPKGGGLRAPNF